MKIPSESRDFEFYVVWTSWGVQPRSQGSSEKDLNRGEETFAALLVCIIWRQIMQTFFQYEPYLFLYLYLVAY